MPAAPVSRRKLFLERHGKSESHLLALTRLLSESKWTPGWLFAKVNMCPSPRRHAEPMQSAWSVQVSEAAGPPPKAWVITGQQFMNLKLIRFRNFQLCLVLIKSGSLKPEEKKEREQEALMCEKRRRK